MTLIPVSGMSFGSHTQKGRDSVIVNDANPERVDDDADPKVETGVRLGTETRIEGGAGVCAVVVTAGASISAGLNLIIYKLSCFLVLHF